jgi:hypothetical protein
LGLIIIFEIIHFVRNNKRYKLLDEFNKKVAVNKKITIHELQEEKVKTKYVLYENYICNVGNFITSHPGGRNLIAENLYTDVGRYLTGTQGYSRRITAHRHNFATIRNLVLNMAYAELIQDNSIVINDRDKSNNIDVSVKVGSIREIAKDTFEYKFIPENYQFTKHLAGHQWIGRHFTISSEDLTKTRYYSLCLSINEVYRTKLGRMLDNALIEKLEYQDVELKLDERHANYICFYIKLYRHSNTLSKYLNESGSEFKLKGPFV